MTGTCKLCGLRKELRHSHIMPDFYITSQEAHIKTGANGIAQPHSLLKSTQADFKDGWMQRNYWEKRVGWKEYLLCGDCEEQLSVYESRARSFLYGNAPPPLKKQLLGSTTICRNPFPPELLEIREVGIDYPTLKLFQMSLLWRASVASGLFFQNIHLGNRHEQKLKQFLAAGNPGGEHDYPCVMYDLRSKHVEMEGFWQEPTCCHDEDGGQKLWKIVIGGYAFMFSVSSHPPSGMVSFYCPKPSGKMFVPVVLADLFLKRCQTRLRKAGKL